MEDMRDQINTILQDPEAMEKIMAMAQNLGQAPPSAPPPERENGFGDIDISMLQKLSGLAGQSNIDSNQRTLLSALRPYLSHERLRKLEKAMRAAKMASLASAFLGNSGFQFLAGR